MSEKLNGKTIFYASAAGLVIGGLMIYALGADNAGVKMRKQIEGCLDAGGVPIVAMRAGQPVMTRADCALTGLAQEWASQNAQ